MNWTSFACGSGTSFAVLVLTLCGIGIKVKRNPEMLLNPLLNRRRKARVRAKSRG